MTNKAFCIFGKLSKFFISFLKRENYFMTQAVTTFK